MSAYNALAEKVRDLFQKPYLPGLVVPIKSIDGVAVEAIIRPKRDRGIRLFITTEFLVCPQEHEERDAEPEELYASEELVYTNISSINGSMMETLFKDIPNLKFDKMNGKFVIGQVEDPFAFLELFQNVETSFQKCCVCMDKTLTTTCCGHHLCYDCTAKIKPIKDADYDPDSDSRKILCPICRGRIAFLF